MSVDLNQQLSPNFSLKEFLFSQTAQRKGIKNIPTQAEVENMKLLCKYVLEPLRAKFCPPGSGRYAKTSSGFRNKQLCIAIGSSTTSQHAQGMAWDGEVPGVSNREVAKWVVDNLNFDQLILECYVPGDPNSGWIHISYVNPAIRKNRKMYGIMSPKGKYSWSTLG